MGVKLLKYACLSFAFLLFVGCNEEDDDNQNGYWVLTEVWRDNRFGNWIEDSWSQDTTHYNDTIINIMKIEDDSLWIYKYLNKDTTTLFRCTIDPKYKTKIQVPERLDTVLFSKSYLDEFCNGSASCRSSYLSGGVGLRPRISLSIHTDKPERQSTRMNIFPYVQTTYYYDYDRYSGGGLPDSWGKEIVEISEKEHYADIVDHFLANHPY